MIFHGCSVGPNDEVYMYKSAPMREWTKEYVGKVVKRNKDSPPTAFHASNEISSDVV